MSQSNLIVIPIDESILFPMESLDQHLVDSSKSNQIISPILRNLLLQYGDQSSFELLNYSETLSEESAKLPEKNTTMNALSQQEISLPDENILSPENIVLPLGIPPINYKMDDIAFKDERQEIAFIKRSTAQKRAIEKTQTTENDINKISQEIQTKVSKKLRMSTDKITKKIATIQNQVKESLPSTSSAQNTEQSTIPIKKKKFKKYSKRKEISKDRDKNPNQKQVKKTPINKKSEQTKNTKRSGKQKTSLSKKEKSSKNRNSRKDLNVEFKESIEEPLDKIKENSSEIKDAVKEETSNTARKKLLKRRSDNDNPLKSEKESFAINTSPAKQSRSSKVDLTNPIYLEPFKYGWRREVVYRALKDKKTVDTTADTYYITPEGKKFRALKEMSAILSKYDHLTKDNFTFVRKPLGINDPTKEIVRNSRVITMVSKKRISLINMNLKSQKSSTQNKDIQKDTNISLPNLEQNSNIRITEKIENATESASQFQEQSNCNKTNDPGATVEHNAELIISACRHDTTAAEYDNKVKEINSTKTLNEITGLDNNKIDNEETLNQKMLPNSQDDNENKNGSNEKCNSKHMNSSIKASIIDHTNKDTKIDSIKSNYLDDCLYKEIRNFAYNNILEEVDSDKEDELSDTKQNLNHYDDPTESEYKSSSIPEQNLEELNSSFSEKIFITESFMKNNDNVESDGFEKKYTLQEIDKENLISEKMSQNNFDYIKHINIKVEISEDSNLPKGLVSECSSTSSDAMNVSATNEANYNIGNELEILNDLKSDKVSVLENSTTDTAKPLKLAI